MELSCTVEILSIGNELLLGNTVNTNAAWLATQVTSLGGNVTRITTVADSLREISQAVKESIKRKPDFLITTGGIGPTFDDMTLKAVAKTLRVRLRLDAAAARMIREHYTRRFPGRRISLTKPRLKMAYIPAGGTAIQNPVGTAPGVLLNVGKTEVFFLPGVPSEAKAIFTNTLSKIIEAKAGGMRFLEKWIKIQGIMESSLAPMLDRVMQRWPGVYVKSHPRGLEANGRPHLELHFSISSLNPKKGEQKLRGATSSLIEELRGSRAQITTAG
jgi:molybdenum cofactor synthesis domain-containing protein